MTRVTPQASRTSRPSQSTQTSQRARTAAEIRRYQAWLAERIVSTAPVDSWPPDEMDFFGAEDQDLARTVRRHSRERTITVRPEDI